MNTGEMLDTVTGFLKDGFGESLAFRETIGESSTSTTIYLPSFSSSSALKGKEIVAWDGANAGESRRIVSWNGTAATVSPAFPFSFAANAKVDVMELGSWPGSIILRALNEAQERIIVDLHSGNFPEYQTWSEKDVYASSTNFYIQAELPDNIAKLLKVYVDEVEAHPYESRNQLNNGYIEAGYCRFGKQLDQTEGPFILIVPNVDANVKFEFIRRPKQITTSVDCELPVICHFPVCELAASILFNRDDQLAAKGQIHLDHYNAFVQAKNQVS